MATNITAHFRELVSLHMGLVIPDKDEVSLAKLLANRTSELKLASATAYCSFLEEHRAESEHEWKHLARCLTIGESYFFRDAGQMMLLEKVILPELLAGKKGEGTLRILSAGCATGEEPYSIAMMMDRLENNYAMPQLPDYQIFGVDINEEALRVAQTGRYGNWSFRGVPQDVQSRYFQSMKNYWQLKKHIRDKVTFRRLNLVRDILPDAINDLHSMDLILCRNVNIYFKKETVERILDKLVKTLTPGGYLLTGHAELQGVVHPMLRMCAYPESVIYQRTIGLNPPLSKSRILPVVVRSTIRPQIKMQPSTQGHQVIQVPDSPVFNARTKDAGETQGEPLVAESTHKHSEQLFHDGHYREVIARTKRMLEKDLSHLDSWRLMARAHANLGEHQEAEACCDRMIKIDAFYAHAYYLKAHIAMDRGDDSKAKDLLKRTLYLDHTFIAPHLELAEIYAREGSAGLARKMRLAALDLLRALPDSAKVDMVDEYTAGELLLDLERLVTS